jgi:hypothetical protein
VKEIVSIFIIKFLTALVLLGSAAIGFIAASIKRKTAKKKAIIAKDEVAKSFVSHFNKAELENSLSGYVVPHCSPADPTNKEGEEFLADTRENIFQYMDRSLAHSERSYHLILADTGMGKTSFCLN